MQSAEHLESDLAGKEESKFLSTTLHPAHLHLLKRAPLPLIVPPFPSLFSPFQVSVGAAAEKNKKGNSLAVQDS